MKRPFQRGLPAESLSVDAMTEEDIYRWLHRTRRIGECWAYQGATNKDGYPVVRFKGRCEYLHRLVEAYARGNLPRGTDVHHEVTCTSRACWNPDHLSRLPYAQHRREALKRHADSLRQGSGTVCEEARGVRDNHVRPVRRRVA